MAVLYCRGWLYCTVEGGCTVLQRVAVGGSTVAVLYVEGGSTVCRGWQYCGSIYRGWQYCVAVLYVEGGSTVAVLHCRGW